MYSKYHFPTYLYKQKSIGTKETTLPQQACRPTVAVLSKYIKSQAQQLVSVSLALGGGGAVKGGSLKLTGQTGRFRYTHLFLNFIDAIKK